jgi:NADPH-dependent ferric siderophore reductase
MPPLATSEPDTQSPDAPSLLHRVRVARRRVLSDGFVRLTFTGPTLDRFADPGLDQRIKLILPTATGSLDDMPFVDDWYGAWRDLPDAVRNPLRTYTVRSFRPDARELDIDFVDHGATGPAGRWIAQATTGDELRIVGPVVPDSQEDLPHTSVEFDASRTGRVLLAGDETAAPAICAILEALDVTAVGHVFIEVPTDDDRLPVTAPSGVEVRWIARNGASHGSAMTSHVEQWASALTAARTRAAGAAPGAGSVLGADGVLVDVDVDHDILWEVPDADAGEDVYAWIAGEAACVKEIRRHLVRGVGIDRRSVAFMGYWRHGRPEN